MPLGSFARGHASAACRFVRGDQAVAVWITAMNSSATRSVNRAAYSSLSLARRRLHLAKKTTTAGPCFGVSWRLQTISARSLATRPSWRSQLACSAPRLPPRRLFGLLLPLLSSSSSVRCCSCGYHGLGCVRPRLPRPRTCSARSLVRADFVPCGRSPPATAAAPLVNAVIIPSCVMTPLRSVVDLSHFPRPNCRLRLLATCRRHYGRSREHLRGLIAIGLAWPPQLLPPPRPAPSRLRSPYSSPTASPAAPAASTRPPPTLRRTLRPWLKAWPPLRRRCHGPPRPPPSAATAPATSRLPGCAAAGVRPLERTAVNGTTGRDFQPAQRTASTSTGLNSIQRSDPP